MVSSELTALLVQVITSWQVISVTVAIVFYMSVVSYVARLYHRPRAALKSKPKKQKAVPPKGPEEVASGANVNEELGLEES
jgi:hypothetical protein